MAECADKSTKTIDFLLEEFAEDVKESGDCGEKPKREEEEEIWFDGTEEQWYSAEEEWVETKDDIARNDWMEEEEADQLLKLYAGKSIKEI